MSTCGQIIEVEQGTPEWLHHRCGSVTASRMADVLAKLKNGGESAARRNYKMEIIAERLTGRVRETFVSKPMEWGIEQEPFARSLYELTYDVSIDTVGFILHPTIASCGASPDGLIGSEGMVEFKCPDTATHVRWMLDGVVPEEHQPQMLLNMACNGRQWCDFGSYDSRLPEDLQLFKVRMPRDEKRIAEIEAEVIQFNKEVDALIQQLWERKHA